MTLLSLEVAGSIPVSDTQKSARFSFFPLLRAFLCLKTVASPETEVLNRKISLVRSLLSEGRGKLRQRLCPAARAVRAQNCSSGSTQSFDRDRLDLVPSTTPHAALTDDPFAGCINGHGIYPNLQATSLSEQAQDARW